MTTTIFAEDVTKLDAETVAIETELGPLPKGTYTNVRARLDAYAAYFILLGVLHIFAVIGLNSLWGTLIDNPNWFGSFTNPYYTVVNL